MDQPGRKLTTTPNTRCLSPDRPGLVTCRQAIAKATAEGGAGSSYPLDAMLETFPDHRPGERAIAWIVTWHGVLEDVGSGAEYTGPPMCRITENAVVIDAETGAFWLESLTSKVPASPCPHA